MCYSPADNAVLLTYGDWTLNTGPVAVCGYDATSGEHVTLLDSVPTEAFTRVRVLENGWTYLPWTDPARGHDAGYSTNEGGHWRNVHTHEAFHVFDITMHDGALITCGSVSTDPTEEVGAGYINRRDPNTGAWTNVFVSELQGGGTTHRIYSLNDPRFNVGSALSATETLQGGMVRLVVSDDGVEWIPQATTHQFSSPLYYDPPNWPAATELHPHAASGPIGVYAGNHFWAYDLSTQSVLRAAVH